MKNQWRIILVPRHKGFSLIELTMVLVIIGLISAVAVPRYIQRSTHNLITFKQNIGKSVKSAMVIAQADNKSLPTVRLLASYVQGEKVTAGTSGVRVTIKGSSYMVPTYTDEQCKSATTSIHDRVHCVGSIP